MEIIKKCFIFFFFLLEQLVLAHDPNTRIIYEPRIVYSTKDGLISNFVYGAIQDKAGYIYFYTNKGISKFDGHKFKNFTTINGLPDNNVWLLSHDKEDNLWIHTDDNNLCLLLNDSIKFVKSFSKKLNILYLTYEVDNSITFHGLLYNFNLKQDGSKYIYKELLQNNGFYHKDNVVQFILQRNNFQYIIPYPSSKLIVNNIENNKMEIYSLENKDFWYTPNIIDNNVYCSSSTGVSIFDQNNNRTWNIKVVNKKIANRSFIDKDKNLWIGYRENGVWLCNLVKFKGDTIIKIKDNIINCIKIKEKLYLFFSTSNMGVFDFQTKTFKFIKRTSGTNNILPWIDDMFILIRNNEKFIIKFDSASSRISNIQFQLKDYPNFTLIKSNRINNDSIVYVDHYSNCYLAFQKNRISKYFKFYQDSLKIKSVISSEENLYLITNKYLSVFNKSLQKIEQIELTLNNRSIITSSAFYFHNLRHLVIGTEGDGIYFIDNKNKLQLIENTYGFDIKSITVLNEKLIVHTNLAIFILKYTESKYVIEKSIANEQGISPEEIVGVYTHNNDLIIVMPNAIHYINPDSIPFKTYNLRITEIYQGNDIKSEDFLKSLPHDFKPISISMSLLDFQISKDVAYQYNLNDNDWQTLAVNTLDLSDLASGSYNLNLRAINKYSNKLLDSKILKLNVLRPWWKTWQFILLINAFLISSIIWGYRKWLNRRNEIKINIRNLEIGLREYKMKALESQMNPHFVYNSLASIQYFIQENKNEEAEHFLTEFGILIRSFLTASRSSQINLKIELELLQKFINLEQIRFSKRFTSEIIIDPKLNLTKIFIPPLLLQPFVENAIQHGLFHRLEGGQLKLNFEASNRDLIVTISDNGIGTKKSKSLKKFSLSNTTSDAMEIFLEKLEIMNKLKPNSLEYSISNLDDTEPYYVGTKIVIIFKNIIVS